MMKRLQLAKKKPCCLYDRNYYFIGILQIKLRQIPLNVVKCNYDVTFNYVQKHFEEFYSFKNNNQITKFPWKGI